MRARVLALVLLVLSGCGAAQVRTGHHVLNTITDVGDPTYAMAVDACDAARDVIIARQGTTYEQDRSAMDSVNEVCDGIVAGFEALRGAQITARAALNSGQFSDTAAAAIREALDLWGRLQRLIPQLATLGRE